MPSNADSLNRLLMAASLGLHDRKRATPVPDEAPEDPIVETRVISPFPDEWPPNGRLLESGAEGQFLDESTPPVEPPYIAPVGSEELQRSMSDEAPSEVTAATAAPAPVSTDEAPRSLVRELSVGAITITITGVGTDGKTTASLTLEVDNDGSGLMLRAKSHGFDASIQQPALAHEADLSEPAFTPLAQQPHVDPYVPQELHEEHCPDDVRLSAARQPRKWWKYVGIGVVFSLVGVAAVGAYSFNVFDIRHVPLNLFNMALNALNVAPAPEISLSGESPANARPATSVPMAASSVAAMMPAVAVVPEPPPPPEMPRPSDATIDAPGGAATSQKPAMEHKNSTSGKSANQPESQAKPAKSVAPPGVDPAPKTAVGKTSEMAIPPEVALKALAPMPVAPTVKAAATESRKPIPSTRIHEQASMTLAEIVMSVAGKPVAWFSDASGRVAFKEGDRLPSGELIKNIDVAQRSVTVSDGGVNTVFFVGK